MLGEKMSEAGLSPTTIRVHDTMIFWNKRENAAS